jgi:hypothetical protein
MEDKPKIKEETKSGWIAQSFDLAKAILKLPTVKLFLVLAFFTICIFAYLKYEMIINGYNSIMNPEQTVRSVFVPDSAKVEQLDSLKVK